MDWTRHVDGYCERLEPGLWAEPANALTNLAFVLATAWAWPRAHGIGRLLAVVLALIGIGSGLFHTVARAWAGAADVAPIAAFILVYVYAANRDFWGMRPWAALIGTLAFFPYAAATGWIFAALPFFEISAGYWPVALLIAAYGVALWRRAPQTARGLWIGAGILAASLTARSLDMPLCDAIPLGTHWLWHLLNAVMLAWMIELHARHVARGPERA